MKHLAAILFLLAAPVVAQTSEQPISGYAFMEPATQELQDDDFLNPAFFLVAEGMEIWNRAWPGANGEARSCRSCHGDPKDSMAGVAARYPTADPDGAGVINLEGMLNREIETRLGGEALAYESQELLALTALVGYQSRGLAMSIDASAQVQDWADRGEEIYTTRHGQLNLSCQNCHVDHSGEKLRGDTISQGHINAFPIFRLIWDEVGSRHRMFTWCMESIRAEPFAAGSDEYLALETYLALRGEGLLIEAPGVRR